MTVHPEREDILFSVPILTYFDRIGHRSVLHDIWYVMQAHTHFMVGSKRQLRGRCPFSPIVIGQFVKMTMHFP